ncbi:hypothetical protein PR048_006705 [Dryococelus australis]|uniref:Reverse transcriptase/retrotransposon-derived protein RNase H-like domain-containing protein n=1 Tax=Dryococelus australis TaxID=614101 RepID=A0ABQ9IBP6_9NEOP|nr:hypothetical protein PR048_006705 [Dryococelus australis]
MEMRQPQKLPRQYRVQCPTKLETQLGQFIVTCKWLRYYVLKLADHLISLNDQLKKDILFQWTNSDQKAFETVKAQFEQIYPLCPPDSTCPLIVQTNTNSLGMGGYAVRGESC